MSYINLTTCATCIATNIHYEKPVRNLQTGHILTKRTYHLGKQICSRKELIRSVTKIYVAVR